MASSYIEFGIIIKDPFSEVQSRNPAEGLTSGQHHKKLGNCFKKTVCEIWCVFIARRKGNKAGAGVLYHQTYQNDVASALKNMGMPIILCNQPQYT